MAEPSKLKVFLCHAVEDKPIVRELYDRLRADGFDPWLDSESLFLGENWLLEIQKAMRASQAVIVCLSEVAIVKEGYIHTEIKTAQELQKEKPEGTIFFIPLQLENCNLPFSMREIQWGHYHEPEGYEKLVKALNKRADQIQAAKGVIKSKKKRVARSSSPKTSVTAKQGSVSVGRDLSHSVIVPGSGNVINVSPANGLWHRPPAPRPSKPMVGRKTEFDQVAQWLREGRTAAITATVQGTPGVGKTVLAEHLAFVLDGEFPGGVIYKQLGVGFR
ncbi:MAG: TIR domain-containing protein, partial [Chloroflexota bacterium]